MSTFFNNEIMDNHELTKQEIIKAASLAFSKFGYKKTTLDDISAFTKVSKTGIYYYFKNKEEVFQAVIKVEAEKLQNNLREAINQEATPINRLFAYVYARMQYLEKISNFYSALKNDLFEQLNVINANRKEFDNIEIEVLSQILKEGVDRGDFFIEDVEEISYVIFTTLKSLEIPLFGIDNDFDKKQFIDNIIKLCLYGIIPR